MTATTVGRPREFDDDAVLASLMDLFWLKGFRDTSMADIVAVSGLSKSSLYNSYGSKEELFERVLGRYLDFREEMITEVLTEGTSGLDDVRAMLDLMHEEITSEGGRRGCLAVNTATELGTTESAVVGFNGRFREIMATGLRAAFVRASELGEIEPAHVERLVAAFVPAMVGMGVVIRGGASDDELALHLDGLALLIDSLTA